MHPFHYAGQRLFCESVDLAEVAQLYGTPTYVYSASALVSNAQRFARCLPGIDTYVCYAVKANGNLAVLRALQRAGLGFDVVSGGEMKRVLAAGAPLTRSVFAGVGKTETEIKSALQGGIYAFHVESEAELARLHHVATVLKVRAPVALRINPDVDAHTHHKISTGQAEHKFGLPWRQATAAYEAASKYPSLLLRGVQIHLGSQITQLDPFVEAVEKLLPLVAELQRRYSLEYFSLGGGLGIPYTEALASGSAAWWQETPLSQRPPSPEEYGAALAPLLQSLGLRILLEPGRAVVGNAGALLTRVEYVKRGSQRPFVIVDAGMNDLLRPALYDAYHEIVPLRRDTTRPAWVADVVGPVCETGDCFGRERRLQQVGEGEYLALLSAGAYGASMASRYNSRALPAEVMVQGSTFELVTAREATDAPLALEKIPAFLR